MPGHVECDDAECGRDTCVVHQAAELAHVGAWCVQAEQGDALSRLLDIEPVRLAEQVEMQIPAQDRLKTLGSKRGLIGWPPGVAQRSRP